MQTQALRPLRRAPWRAGPTAVSDRERGLPAAWAADQRATRSARARARPRTARIVARLGPRTPEGTTSTVLVLTGVDRGATAGSGSRCGSPMLPNNSLGLGRTRAAARRLRRASRRIWWSTRRRLARDAVSQRGRAILSASGSASAGPSRPDTRRACFYVRNELTRFASAVLLGRSPSARALDYGRPHRLAGRRRIVGIHGTDEPGRHSRPHRPGCIRLRNADIVRLARLMPPGTPVTIR